MTPRVGYCAEHMAAGCYSGACGCGCEEQMLKLINMKGRLGIVLPGAVYIGRQM